MNTKPIQQFIICILLGLLLSACGPGQRLGPEPTPTPQSYPFTGLENAYEQAKSIETAVAEYEEGGYPMTAVLTYQVEDKTPSLAAAAFTFVQPDGKTITVGLDASGESHVVKSDEPVPGFPSSINEIFVYFYINEQEVLKRGWDKLGSAVERECGPVTGLELVLTGSGEGFDVTSQGMEVRESVPGWRFIYNGSARLVLSGYKFETMDRSDPCP